MRTLDVQAPVRLLAPAKLNLGLEVLGRRSDGYHEVVTVMQAISLFDTVDLTPADRLTYCPIPGIRRDDDLVWRALTIARETLGIELRATVRVDKGIPVSAGLGGGSSDAGTLLGALAAWAGRSADEAEAAAAQLGSDVPFFVRGGTALATGTGTHLTRLPDIPRLWFVLLTPPVEIPQKTAALYGELTPADYGDGSVTRQQVDRLLAGEPLDIALLRNSFTRPLLARPAIQDAHAALLAAGAEVVQVSGAGPSLYAPVSTFAEAVRIAKAVGRMHGRVHICTTLRAGLNDAPLAADGVVAR